MADLPPNHVSNRQSDEVIVNNEIEVLLPSQLETPATDLYDPINSFVITKPLDWFNVPLFLILCPMYMLIRLIINISQVNNLVCGAKFIRLHKLRFYETLPLGWLLRNYPTQLLRLYHILVRNNYYLSV